MSEQQKHPLVAKVGALVLWFDENRISADLLPWDENDWIYEEFLALRRANWRIIHPVH